MEKIKELYKLAKEHKKISIAIGVVIFIIIAIEYHFRRSIDILTRDVRNG